MPLEGLGLWAHLLGRRDYLARSRETGPSENPPGVWGNPFTFLDPTPWGQVQKEEETMRWILSFSMEFLYLHPIGIFLQVNKDPEGALKQ